jgi:hypothetical protein
MLDRGWRMNGLHTEGRLGHTISAAVWARWGIAVLAGTLTGGAAAWAYYDAVYRPLSHTFGLWILTVALLSARQPRISAIGASCLALLAAVVAFYVGKKLMYGIRYPGMPYELNTTQLTEWGVLAVIAGIALGAAFAGIGTTGHRSTAAAIGLLAADAYRRASSYPSDGVVVISFGVLAVVAVLAVAIRTPRQLLQTAAWTLPAIALGYLLISAPDLLESLRR